MKYIIGKHTLPLLLTAAFMLLTGCSSDDADTSRKTPSMVMQPLVISYVDVPQPATTRAWTPPAGYVSYSVNSSIRVTFTRGTSIAKSDNSDLNADGGFAYIAGESKWKSSFILPKADSDPYYIYGYAPSLGSSTLSPVDGDYSKGASMTINSLPSASASDMGIIVGVKRGTSESDEIIINDVSDGGIKVGQFGYTFGGENENYVYLLFEHLYSALRLRFKVNDKYNELRTIKLKKLEVASVYFGETPLNSTLQATVVVKSNTTGSSPIQSTSFDTEDGSAEMSAVEFYKSVEGDLLPITYPETPVYYDCFVPFGATAFTLRSTFDIYDKKGNLIREDDVSDNKIDLNKLFRIDGLVRGKRYTINLTVNPTYLYMMSEPDLENPMPVVDGGN